MLLFVPNCSESRNKPGLCAHNADGPGKVFHTWHTQNATKKHTQNIVIYRIEQN